MVVGCLIFVLIWAGIDELFELIGKYQEAKWVVLFLGVGKIINISTGAMGAIIVSSRFYIFSMYSMFFLAIITYVLNLYFIPMYKINGAALATLISLATYYSFSFFLLKIKTGLQPFTSKTILLILISAGLFYFAEKVDFGLQSFIEILLKSIIISCFYIVLIYYFNISEDINKIIRKTSEKAIKVITQRIKKSK